MLLLGDSAAAVAVWQVPRRRGTVSVDPLCACLQMRHGAITRDLEHLVVLVQRPKGKNMSSTASNSELAASQSRAIPPITLLSGITIICLAAHALLFQWPAFELVQTFVGAVVVALAFGLIGLAARSFKSRGEGFPLLTHSTTLVTDGAYRFSRNPIYLGMTGILAGLAVIFSSILFVAAAVLFLVAVHVTFVLSEEKRMEAKHGDAYRRYKIQVHRWL
jgi:protein-S-isoprenylcysteine O-methyltransferase Ste14